MATVGVGVFGLGYMGRAEAKLIQAHPGARLVGVASRRFTTAQSVAESLGCQAFPDLETLLAQEGLDAVIIATPNNLHTQPVLEAVRRGKHVYLEKPMALRVVECDEMIHAAREAGVHLMVGHMMRFYDGMRRAKEFVASGALGRPMVAHAERTGWEPPMPEVSWKKRQAESGGHLFHHIHEIDMLLWLFGEVEEVFCYAENLAHHGPGYGDEDDVIVLLLRFRNGAIGTMHYGGGFRFGDHFFRVSGDRGGVMASHRTASVVFREEGIADRTEPLFHDEASQQSILDLFNRKDLGIAYGRPTDDPPTYLTEYLNRALDAWLRVVAGEAVPEWLGPVMDGTAGRAAVEVAEAALLSARTGRPVRLPLEEVES